MKHLPAKIILHVGMAKAGSTAIQNALDTHYDALLKQRVLFPRSILRRSNPADPERTPGHLDLLDQLARGETSPLAAELAQHAGQIDTLLLSIENIFHMTTDPKIEILAKFLSSHEVALIAVLRDQLSWFQALYYEVVVGGIRKTPIPSHTFLTEIIDTGVFDYANRLEELTRQFNARSVATLPHASSGETSLLERFIGSAGISLPSVETLGKKAVNVSVQSKAAVETHRWLNLFLRDLPRGESLIFSQEMKSFYRTLPRQQTPLLSSKAQQRISDVVGDTNQRLPCSLSLTTAPREPAARRRTDAAISQAFRHGLHHLAQKTGEIQVNIRHRRQQLNGRCFSPEEAALLLREMACASVISICDEPTTLALAAAEPGRLIYAIVDSAAERRRQQRLFDALTPPSPVLFHSCAAPPAPQSPLRPIDLAFLKAGPKSAHQLAQLKPERFVLDRAQPTADYQLPGADWLLCAQAGQLRVYQPRKAASCHPNTQPALVTS